MLRNGYSCRLNSLSKVWHELATHLIIALLLFGCRKVFCKVNILLNKLGYKKLDMNTTTLRNSVFS